MSSCWAKDDARDKLEGRDKRLMNNIIIILIIIIITIIIKIIISL